MIDEKTPQVRYLEEVIKRRHRTPVTVLDSVLGRQAIPTANLSLESRVEENKLKAIEKQLENLVGGSMLGHRSLKAYAESQIALNGFASMDPVKDEHLIAPVLAKIEAEKSKYPSPLEATYVCTLNKVINDGRRPAIPGELGQPEALKRTARLTVTVSDQQIRDDRHDKADVERRVARSGAGLQHNLQHDIIDHIASNGVSISRWEEFEKAASLKISTPDDECFPNHWSEQVTEICNRIRNDAMPTGQGYLELTPKSKTLSSTDAVKAGKLIRTRKNIQARKLAAIGVADTVSSIIKPTDDNLEKKLARLRAVSVFRDYWLEPGEHLHLPNTNVAMHHLSALKGEKYDKHVALAHQLKQFDEIWNQSVSKTRAPPEHNGDRQRQAIERVPATLSTSVTTSTKRFATTAFPDSAVDPNLPGKRPKIADLRGIEDRPNNRARGTRDI